MFSRIFIDRPKLALVISILILIVGGISIPMLPVESMPDVTPPTIAESGVGSGCGKPEAKVGLQLI